MVCAEALLDMMTKLLTYLRYVWLGEWRIGRRETIGRVESVNDEDDYNNSSSCLVGRKER